MAENLRSPLAGSKALDSSLDASINQVLLRVTLRGVRRIRWTRDEGKHRLYAVKNLGQMSDLILCLDPLNSRGELLGGCILENMSDKELWATKRSNLS